MFDYGNNIRAQAQQAGVGDAFDIPGFVPEYIRPLFCEGKGPFRWAALSGDPADIAATDRAVLELFPHDEALARWIPTGRASAWRSRGCPRASAGSGYGERADVRPADQRDGAQRRAEGADRHRPRSSRHRARSRRRTARRKACATAATPSRDWPILNALLNAASGATWVSVHHGGGVGIGYSLHAGMVIVADGSQEADARLERVLTCDPGIGVVAPRGCRLSRSHRDSGRARHQAADDTPREDGRAMTHRATRRSNGACSRRSTRGPRGSPCWWEAAARGRTFLLRRLRERLGAVGLPVHGHRAGGHDARAPAATVLAGLVAVTRAGRVRRRAIAARGVRRDSGVLPGRARPDGAPATFLLDEVLEFRTFENFPGLRHVFHDLLAALRGIDATASS